MTEALLSLAGVNARYGRARILFDVGFDVNRGEVKALLGRNGAGKSTTLKAIIGMLRPVTGTITFAGQRIESEPLHRIARRGLGYVPEQRRIFTELTVLENLEVGRRPARADLTAWTPERVFDLFPALGEMKHRPGGRMSGGEQQMLAIARTLMGNPILLLLDEPSEGLSPKILGQLAAMLQNLKAEGLTIILSEQNMHFAAGIADRATMIEQGRIRHCGEMGRLAEDLALQRQYLMA